MKLLVDAQLPPALARLLCELGHEAVAVRDVNLREEIERRLLAGDRIVEVS